jgi:tight adherence protein C
MTWQQIIPVLLFAAVALATYVALRLFESQHLRVQSRVNELMATGARNQFVGYAGSRKLAFVGSQVLDWAGRANPLETENRANLEKRLLKAGIYGSSKASWFFAVKFCLMTVPCVVSGAAGLLGWIAPERALLLGSTLGGFGALVPSFWLDKKIRQRHLSIRRSLPDFLDLMIVCLEGGLSLQETLRRVNEELQLAHPILAHELSVVERDIDLCSSPDQALKRWAVRTDFDAIRTLSTFVRESQRFGTQITDALRNHADMMRSQREQNAEENAQKAAVKILLPTLLLIFPAIFVVLVGPAVIQIQEAFAQK